MNTITVDEAKNYLRVDAADDNALITSLVAAADDIVERYTRQTLLTTSFELVYDSAGASIEIPKSPLQEITKIEVIDDAGSKTEVSSSLYVVDISGQRGRVALKNGCAWPYHRGFASFLITAKAGYGDAAASVPAALRQAAFIALAILYDNRGQLDEGKIFAAIADLCAPYRIIRL